MNDISNYILIEGISKTEKFEKSLEWVKGLERIFDLAQLHPLSLVRCYLAGAQSYMLGEQKDTKKALELLESYTTIVEKLGEDIRLKGNLYFDQIEDWLENLDLGTKITWDVQSMKVSLYQGVAENPAFEVLKEEADFKILLKRLEKCAYREREKTN